MDEAGLSTHPLNLAFRFLLELLALAALGLGGWAWGPGASRFLFAVLAPLTGAALWGTFRVPGDPSASGRAPVAVPGWARLVLEACFFGAATAALRLAAHPRLALAFGAATLLHYALSFDRIRWLLQGAD